MHNVGKVLFVIPAGVAAVVPVRVIEILTRINDTGKITSYKVEDHTGKVKTLKQDDKTFDSAEDVTEALMIQLRKNVDRIVTKALVCTEKWDNKIVNDDNANDDGIIVELPDGTTATLKK